ncbi:MAG: FAD/NAD(P)-binding protein [Bacteroidota bacterium]|nr:FAD/NAD(P)-binding protein [Bacteroidota bacterium]
MKPRKKIIIIGSGLSGVLVAIQLANSDKSLEIILLEKDPEKLGRGVAYQQEFTHQPLNVIASGMSIYTDRPSDFLDWLQTNSFRYNHLILSVDKNSFIPRKIFGDYLVERLKEAHDKGGDHFQIRIEEAVSVNQDNLTHKVTLASGQILEADHVILALGNFPPSDVLPQGNTIKNARYFTIPWTDKIYQNIQGNEEILLIGTGLTAVDVVLGLHLRNFKGRITMLSRRGRLPLPHLISSEKFLWEDDYLLPPAALFKLIRKKIKANPSVSWTLIVDSLRPFVQGIWKHWSVDEKKEFMKRYRPLWEVARHRIPPASSRILEDLSRSGKLRVLKGKILHVHETSESIITTFANDKTEEITSFHSIINCTGPESNYRKVKFPIIQSLMEKGKVVPDSLGLGILCMEDGNLLDQNSNPVPGLWCIGPMRKAVLWETTALREIREQAEEILLRIQESR